MDGCPRRCVFLIGCCLTVAGCVAQQLPSEPFAGPPTTTTADAAAVVPQSPYARGPAQAAAGEAIAAGAPAARTEPAARPDDSAALQSILAELQALGTVDQATQNQLMADLRQTDPTLWPILMQTFRAGAAYRRKATADPADTKPILQASVAAVPPPNSPNEAAASHIAAETTTVRTSGAPLPVATPGALPTPAAAAPQLPPLPMEALQTQFANRGGGTDGLTLPSQALIGAAMAEAQRKEAEQSAAPPPASAAPAPEKVVQAADKSAKQGEEKVTASSAEKSIASDEAWRDSLAASIQSLERLTAESPHSATEVTRHAWLRMLYLTAGRREDALKPIPGIAAAEQDFWREQIYALAVCLDNERASDPAKRSAEARKHLARADSRLAEAGTLAVRNLAFCTEVSSYGVYKKFEEYEFKANQPLILYAEVQNFKSEESSKGFHTSLRSSYQILDAQGRRVAENDLALTEEYCQNERRDYFIRYFLSVPERIYDGKYTLQLTIVDALSQKIGQSTIDFTVGEKK